MESFYEPFYELVNEETNDLVVVIRDVGDWRVRPTISQRPNAVFEHLAHLLKGRRLLYYNSCGQLCEIHYRTRPVAAVIAPNNPEHQAYYNETLEAFTKSLTEYARARHHKTGYVPTLETVAMAVVDAASAVLFGAQQSATVEHTDPSWRAMQSVATACQEEIMRTARQLAAKTPA